MQLSQKESELLKELKDQEKLCIEKYTKHSSCAKDPQLKNLFSSLASGEQQHLAALDALGEGTVPSPFTAGGAQQSFTNTYSAADNPDKQADCYLCTDLLTSEKHSSHLYDTCVFEFKDKNARDLLNSIQKQEQGHGKAIYDYMAANSMY